MRYRYVYFTAAIVFIALYVVFIEEYETINQTQAGGGVLLIILGVLPAIISLVNQREANLIPLMPLHGFFYVVTFGLPIFDSQLFKRRSGSDVLTETLLLSIFGLVCLYLGYYAFRGLYPRRKAIQFLKKINTKGKLRTAWIIYGLYLLFQMIPALASLSSVSHLSDPFGYISLGMLFLLALDNALPKRHLFLLKIVIPGTIIGKLLTGSLAPAFFLLIFFGIIYWHKKRVIPWHYILITILMVIALNPVKHVYRKTAWAGDIFSTLSYSEKASLFYEAVNNYYEGGILYSLSDDTSTAERTGHISILAHVIKMTPEQVPYWGGDSYKTLWTSFIPRILWPGKPEATIGQDFGHRYILLHSTDDTTSFNLPWLVEFYANFGMLGVLGGMFAVGMLFRFLVQMLKCTTEPQFRICSRVNYYIQFVLRRIKLCYDDGRSVAEISCLSNNSTVADITLCPEIYVSSGQQCYSNRQATSHELATMTMYLKCLRCIWGENANSKV